MKNIGKLILAIAVILPLMVGGLSVRAASEEDIENSIVAGLAWLAAEQRPDGSWGEYDWTAEGATGLAVLKFEERARELELDPFAPAYLYHQQVEDGLNYLFSRTQETGGLVWITTPLSWNDNYDTGIGMMALAASASPARIVPPLGSPVDGWTYQEVLEGMLDWMEDAQGDGGCEIGGWGYVANDDWADQSNSGYSTLGIGYAISPVYGFGLTVDPNVLAKLGIFIDNVQRPDGGSDYTHCGPWDQSNMLRTGNLLYEMALIGRPVDHPTVQAAIGYIENNWPAEMGDTQTRFTVMKGLEAYQIDTLTVGMVEIDWFDGVSTWIVDEQNPDDGSWPGGWLHLDTAWNLLTLERVVALVVIEVDIDIKPGSDPNSINLRSKGVIPVAILTTEDFDATTVDWTTVRFGPTGTEASPVHDLSDPLVLADHQQDVDGDGDLDLVLHFRVRESGISSGDTEACLTGETLGGVPIEGCDSVRTVPPR